MSDSERIIGLLQTAERRIRANRILHEIASGLAIALLLPVLFKIIDLFVSLQWVTVSAFFAVWAVSAVLWIVWRTRGLREPLPRMAANIDKKSSGPRSAEDRVLVYP